MQHSASASPPASKSPIPVATLPRQLEIVFKFRLDPAKWTDDETEQAYAVLLEESLKVLDPDNKHAKSRARKDEIRDVVRWFFASEYQYFAVDGQLVRVKTEQIPLTFGACCRFFGYNPERLRETVVGYLKQLGCTDGVPAEYL